MAIINNANEHLNTGDYTATETEFSAMNAANYGEGTMVTVLDDAGVQGIIHIYIKKDGAWKVYA